MVSCLKLFSFGLCRPLSLFLLGRLSRSFLRFLHLLSVCMWQMEASIDWSYFVCSLQMSAWKLMKAMLHQLQATCMKAVSATAAF